MVYTVDMMYTVDTVYTVYTIHCLNISIYAFIYDLIIILIGKVGTLLEWPDAHLSKKCEWMGDRVDTP